VNNSTFTPLTEMRPSLGLYVVIVTLRDVAGKATPQSRMHRAFVNHDGSFTISPRNGATLPFNNGEKVYRWKDCDWPDLC